MAKLPRLAATLTEQDTRLSEVLRLSLVEGLSIRAIAKRLKLSRRTVRRLLARGPERKPPVSEPRPSLLDAYDAKIRQLLAETPELTAPGILERLLAGPRALAGAAGRSLRRRMLARHSTALRAAGHSSGCRTLARRSTAPRVARARQVAERSLDRPMRRWTLVGAAERSPRRSPDHSSGRRTLAAVPDAGAGAARARAAPPGHSATYSGASSGCGGRSRN